MNFTYAEGATPIDPSEAKDLITTGLTLQSELNELEERNIVEGSSWAFGRKRKDWLTIAFILELHRKMFGNVWRWAGCFRKTNKNIGVDRS